MTRDKVKKIAYWIVTLWLAFSMVSSGIFQLFRLPGGHEFIIRDLGYPSYFLTILGIWKFLGVAALLVPKFPLVKEWAYAGFFFVATGALFSHLASRSSVADIVPCVLLVILTVASWMLRPASRRLVP
ncbi:MAG: DoxX family protein [Fibrobacteria bacterium]|jgi:uncharacterized membrane protein YphA (DoxX/SURF4 family)|nr:DoxX family protein [Fibrobacteria bacterium]